MQIATEAGHWYDEDGTPRYTVIAKNGNERPTTLRDAKKYGYYPSYSGIEGCCAKPQLNNWDIDQHLETAALNPPLVGESFEAFRDRIKRATKERKNKVRDLGSAIHGAIEKFLKGQVDLEFSEHSKAALTALEKWCGPGPYGVERSFKHSLGYGGKVDAHKPGFVSDFKTKEFGYEDLPIPVWDNHSMQLTAYRHGLGMPTARCAIIYVSTSIPGLTHTVEVGSDELDRGWEMFKALLAYWKHKNRYLTGD